MYGVCIYCAQWNWPAMNILNGRWCPSAEYVYWTAYFFFSYSIIIIIVFFPNSILVCTLYPCMCMRVNIYTWMCVPLLARGSNNTRSCDWIASIVHFNLLETISMKWRTGRILMYQWDTLKMWIGMENKLRLTMFEVKGIIFYRPKSVLILKLLHFLNDLK